MAGTGAGIGSSARVLKDSIVFGALDNFVYALNQKNGEIEQ